MAIIYCIKNKINNKRYVGVTSKTIKARWNSHLYAHKNNIKMLLYSAFEKYGVKNFIIYELEEESDIKKAYKKETYWIKKLKTFGKNGYNLSFGGLGGIGVKRTKEYLFKQSISQKGKKRKFKDTLKSSKTWICTTPKGRIFKIRNLSNWARKKNFNIRSIISHKTYKGYTFLPIGY